jgi:hypothetical protein
LTPAAIFFITQALTEKRRGKMGACFWVRIALEFVFGMDFLLTVCASAWLGAWVALGLLREYRLRSQIRERLEQIEFAPSLYQQREEALRGVSPTFWAHWKAAIYPAWRWKK